MKHLGSSCLGPCIDVNSDLISLFHLDNHVRNQTRNTTMTAAAPRFDRAILEASMAALGNAAAATTSPAAPQKDKASIYLAFAQLRDGADTQNPDPVKDFITLPQMTGLDNMNPDTRRAGTQEFANDQAERNEFLQDLIEQSMATLAPGETRLIPLYVTIYRKKDEVVAAPVEARKREKISFFAPATA